MNVEIRVVVVSFMLGLLEDLSMLQGFLTSDWAGMPKWLNVIVVSKVRLVGASLSLVSVVLCRCPSVSHYVFMWIPVTIEGSKILLSCPSVLVFCRLLSGTCCHSYILFLFCLFLFDFC
jgi:hypothetical protein